MPKSKNWTLSKAMYSILTDEKSSFKSSRDLHGKIKTNKTPQNSYSVWLYWSSQQGRRLDICRFIN